MDNPAVGRREPVVDSPEDLEAFVATLATKVTTAAPAATQEAILGSIGLLIDQLKAMRDDMTKAITQTSEAAVAVRAATTCAQRVGGLDYALWIILFGAGALIGVNLAYHGWL